jgi:hypothetical protein
MSFRCEFCNQPQPAAARPVRIVTWIRQQDQRGGWGWEIAAEKNACGICADRVGAPAADPRHPDRPARFRITERAAAAVADLYRPWAEEER